MRVLYILFATFCKSFLIFWLDKLFRKVFFKEVVRFCPFVCCQSFTIFFTKFLNARNLVNGDSFFRHFTPVFVSFRKCWILKKRFSDRPVSLDKIKDSFSWYSIHAPVCSIDQNFFISEGKTEFHKSVHCWIFNLCQSEFVHLNIFNTVFHGIFKSFDCRR